MLDKQPREIVSPSTASGFSNHTTTAPSNSVDAIVYIPYYSASMVILTGGLNGLPTELLCNIFRLVIGREDTKENRCRLILVCRQWREYVEGSASLWSDISARDSATYVRRALERSGGAMLSLHCWVYWRRPLEFKAFMTEVGPHIARWRSLMVGLRRPSSLETLLAPLTTTQAPNLEILKLRVVRPRDWISGNAITLFGGAPAPSTLRELTLEQIPVAIEPLNLSGLVSLDLTHVPTIATLQLFEILRRSPSLETLSLEGNLKLVAMGSHASIIRPIELPKLDSLSLRGVDRDGANCILSTIRIPNRGRVYIRGDMSKASSLFTSTIAHLLHTTNPAAGVQSSAIRVEGQTYGDFTVKFRGIEIESLFMNGREHVPEVLRWLADGLGSEAAECPIHLTLDWSEMDSVPLATVPPPLVVKHLSIPDSVPDSSREALYIAMVRPPVAASSDWLHSQLESLSVGFASMESQKQLVSMLRSRYEGATVPGEIGVRCPVGLRSVELRGSPRTEGLVEEITGILGEANVFWVDEEAP